MHTGKDLNPQPIQIVSAAELQPFLLDEFNSDINILGHKFKRWLMTEQEWGIECLLRAPSFHSVHLTVSTQCNHYTPTE